MSFLDKKRFADSLHYNHFYQMVGWRIADDGRSMYEQGLVKINSYTDNSLDCEVSGTAIIPYHVTLKMTSNQFIYGCSCKHAQRGNLCKHVVAAGVAVQKILSEDVKKSWENRLLFVHETPPARKPAAQKATPYLLIFVLYLNYNTWRIRPLTVQLEKILAAGVEPPEEWDNQTLLNLINTSEIPTSAFKSDIKHRLTPEMCLNAPTQIVHLAQMLHQLSSTASGYFSVSGPERATPGVLESLRDENFPLFLGQAGYSEAVSLENGRPLTVLHDSASVLLDIEKQKDDSLRMQFHLYLGKELWKVTKKPTVITQNPLWLMMDNMLIPAEESLDVEQIENLGKASRVIIPAAETERFLTEYVPRLADRFNITGSGVNTQDVLEKPRPRLYLEDHESTLEVTLKFGYGEFEVPYESRIPVSSASYDLQTVTFSRIFRDADAEKKAYGQVSDYGLKRATGEPGLFNLRAKVDVVDFLVRYVPKATADGFEIYGQDNIKNVRVNHHKPSISFNISSGIDWFDLKTSIQYGDVSVPLKEMRRALKRNESYIMLADGSIGEVPQAWLERYKHVFSLGEENGDDLRFSNQQVTLLDQLLGESERVSTDAEFQRRRQRLRNFESITPQPLPQNITAELRPYQKAGVDWLHFLREYQFGGCLADDMGLGKTVQVLTFLQALKEKKVSTKATLVVLPRSLLVNWQRESEKFTPELRMLEYHGQFREKDTAIFDQYDVVLTTYGIVIKDIELLRAYRFHYVILDESQAIKNPVSQSAKGCRLLQADHHLVMTGTPVENSTMELWSQFAFLNPGLLGNLDYFRTEIGGPIERDANAETAQFLRKMVYPFILRRTKEQVAPELPPRTERIIYGDMEPAQRKIYTRTREDYRKNLLGLIDGQGMDNARMKILEGLLRLRQICIHPRLVDKLYHGESAKFELLTEQIETLMAEGHKALIFSQFVETLKLLRLYLDERNIRYAYLDGQTVNRQDQVDAFQNQPAISFFLISLKAGGVGLNLTAADYVIHIDPWWNPAVEMQASDRAHRIGQDKPVFVYKYILRDSVEEKILLLQERKRNLVNQLISTETSFFKSLTKDDVQALFS